MDARSRRFLLALVLSSLTGCVGSHGAPDAGSERDAGVDTGVPLEGNAACEAAQALELSPPSLPPGEEPVSAGQPAGFGVLTLPPCEPGDVSLHHARFYRVTVPAGDTLVVRLSEGACSEGGCDEIVGRILDGCDGACLASEVDRVERCACGGDCLRWRNGSARDRAVIVAVGTASPWSGEGEGPDLVIAPSVGAVAACESALPYSGGFGEHVDPLYAQPALDACGPGDAPLAAGSAYHTIEVPAGSYAYARARSYPNFEGTCCPCSGAGVPALARLLDGCDGSCLTETRPDVRWVNETGADATVVLASGPEGPRFDGNRYYLTVEVAEPPANAICEDATVVSDGQTVEVPGWGGAEVLPRCGEEPEMPYPVYFRATVPAGGSFQVYADSGMERDVRFFESCAAARGGACIAPSSPGRLTNASATPMDVMVAVSSSTEIGFAIVPAP